MVSDQELANCAESLFRQSDPTTTAISPVDVSRVVRQLEAKLGLDLSHKVEFIRDHITTLLRHSKDHFVLHLQQQQLQQQRHLQQQQQQQYTSGYPHPLLPPHYQILHSPFTHLPHQHELAFRSAPPVQQQVVASAAVPQMQKQEGSSGNSALGATSAAPAKGSAQTGVKRRGGPGGLNKVCGVSPELQAIVGEPTMARTQIVKQLWAYIRKNNLQDPSNKRKIICNDELRLVFETDCTDMFKMNKLLAKHIIALEPSKESCPDSKRVKAVEDVPGTEHESADYPIVISDALAEFFGIEEREMLQSEALKHVWDYIKANQLEDPSNSTMIQFDSKLQQLFGCESSSALGVSEMLSQHLFKRS